jgi:hypothetical protein
LITPVVGLLLCTPKYLAGTMTLGEVVQAAAAFVVVLGAFSWFTDNYARLAEWAASAWHPCFWRWTRSMVKAKTLPLSAAVQASSGTRHRLDLDQCDPAVSGAA